MICRSLDASANNFWLAVKVENLADSDFEHIKHLPKPVTLWLTAPCINMGVKNHAIILLINNPTINSSIVRYDSNCSHKSRGTSKPTFSSPKGHFPSIYVSQQNIE